MPSVHLLGWAATTVRGAMASILGPLESAHAVIVVGAVDPWMPLPLSCATPVRPARWLDLARG
jgi:hypothetical protein